MKDFLKQEGPKMENIPAQSYLSCSGCKFYDYHMVRSGMESLYARNCTHPDLPNKYKFNSWMRGNLGDNKITPDWCPVKNQKK